MMHEHWLEERGIYYRTNDWVPGRPTLVFVHGVSGSSVAWVRYEEYFFARYNILSYDLRGHGKSKKYSSRKDYALPELASDLRFLIDKLDTHDVILISHSFGTLVVQEYLSQHAESARAAIFISPSMKGRHGLAMRLTEPFVIGLASVLDLFPRSTAASKRIGYDVCPDRGDWDLRRRFVDIRNTGLRIYLDAFSQMYQADYTAAVCKFTLPSLVIHGTADTLFPSALGRELANILPSGSFAPILGADHILVLNRYDDVVAVMDNFLSNIILEDIH